MLALSASETDDEHQDRKADHRRDRDGKIEYSSDENRDDQRANCRNSHDSGDWRPARSTESTLRRPSTLSVQTPCRSRAADRVEAGIGEPRVS